MTSQVGYNIVKEGDLYNTEQATYAVSVSGLESLYKNSVGVEAFTIPIGSVASVELRFGEYFDVHNIKLYCSPLIISNITVGYGNELYTENTPQVVSSGTFAYINLQSPVGVCRITCSGSVETVVSSLFVEGTKNDSLYFGTLSGFLGPTYVGNSPIGYYSSTAQQIPICNTGNVVCDANVSVATVGSYVDQFLYIGTTATGTFYGVNEHGISQPAFDPLIFTTDSLSYSDAEDILNNWEVVSTAGSYIDLNSDSVSIYSLYDNVNTNVYRSTYGYNESSLISMICKDTFTSNQSFTASLWMKFTNSSFDSYADYWVNTPNKFMFGFTNSFPILEPLQSTFTVDQWAGTRLGRSFASVWVGGKHRDINDLYVGGAVNVNDFSSNPAITDLNVLRSSSNSGSIISQYSLEDIAQKVLQEANYTDGTTNAPWRNLKVSYSHQDHKVLFLFDGVVVGEYYFNSASFFEGCRFFFGFMGLGTAVVEVKNFSVEKDKFLGVQVDQVGASAYGSKDSTQVASKLIDRWYGGNSFSTAWVSPTVPTPADYFNVDFGAPYTIEGVRIKRAFEGDSITVSGLSSYTPTGLVRTLQINFDTGDQRYAYFPTEFLDINGWDVAYLYTVSGVRSPVYGTSSVSSKFYQVDSIDGTCGCVVIDEVEFFSVSGTVCVSGNSYDEGDILFSAGRKKNLEKKSTAPTLVIKSKDLYDISTEEMCHKLVGGIDYGASSLSYNNDVSDSLVNRHYAESVFKREGRGSSGGIVCNIDTGPEAFVWRQFDSIVDLKSAFINFRSALSDFTGKPDRWKLQYLRIGGVPSNDFDWINISPTALSYHTISDYKTYTDYLIANNDGEYYTSYLNAFDSIGSIFSLPVDLLCYRNRDNKQAYLYGDSQNLSIYVEFDSVVRTQGLRLYIQDGYTSSSRGTQASGYTLSYFMCYSSTAIGSYLSPVVDVGTKQNTERIFTNVKNNGGSSFTMYRAHSACPEYAYDPLYEEWEDLGPAYGGLSEFSSNPLYFAGRNFSMVAVGSSIYFFGSNPDVNTRVYSYDTITRKWGYGLSLPVESDGNVSLPDFRTRNSIINTGDSLLMAECTDGNTGIYTSGIYKYNINENTYAYSGWEVFPSQRQTNAVFAGMAYDNNSKLYFVGLDGTITVFDSTTGRINTEGRAKAPIHGIFARDYFVPVIANGKLFVIGGSYGSDITALDSVDIYDIATDTWSSGTAAPYWLKSVWCIFYDPYIYVLPYAFVGTSYNPVLKYNVYTDVWTDVVSLSYDRATYFLETSADVVGNPIVPQTYCLCNGYIYCYSALRDSFRRTKVSRQGWVSGVLPSKDDVYWRDPGGLPWVEATISGELMPQDRYMQYKAVISSEEEKPSPAFVSSCFVSPVVVENIPSSGTGYVYVKTGISTDYQTEAWYTGKRYSGVGSSTVLSSIIYGITSNSLDICSSIPAITSTTYSGAYALGYFDPYVIKGQDYTLWAAHGAIVGSSLTSLSDIHRAQSVDGFNWSVPVHSIGRGTLPTYDSNGVYGPCVLYNSVYKMWYTGVDIGGTTRILYADSADGVLWTNTAMVHNIGTVGLDYDADSMGTSYPAVVYLDGIYYMWYSGLDSVGVCRIVRCVSTDGVSWSNHSVVFIPQDVSTSFTRCICPRVVYDNGYYKLWFLCGDFVSLMVYYVQSLDGVFWSTPVVVLGVGEEGEYDAVSIGTPIVIFNRLHEEPNGVLSGKLKVLNV